MNQVSLEQYLHSLKPEQREQYDRVSKLIHRMADATVTMSYGMPTFKYQGKLILHFGAFSDHLSIFPGSQAVSELEDLLTDFKTSKGTIQFTAKHPLPDTTLEKIVQNRLDNIKASS